MYEKYLYNQMQQYFDKILSKYQRGFPKGCKSQNCLVDKNWYNDKGDKFLALY